jgi:predicted dehydrogenase
MDSVRFGIIGLGGMGNFHLGYLNTIEGAKIAAVCDVDAKRVDTTAAKYDAQAPGGKVGRFTSVGEMLASKSVDAVLIATPHPLHPPATIAAFKAGLHVLSEKPVAVTVKQAREMNAAHAASGKKFSLMYQMRTVPQYKKMRELIADGELGEITRITWLITDWFRTWTYFASGGWRATWAGEGGGVLINQCPHNLDLIQWVTGLSPSRVTAVAFVGKTHPIEVEDEVSAILEYPNGAIGHFVTTTGEAPGTNRFEVCGDRGKLVSEGGKLTFTRTRKSVREIRETSPEMFPNAETWTFEIPTGAENPAPHKIIVQNFVNAILKDEPLIAPGNEGVMGLELGNAMLMAGLSRKPVDLPLDGDAYEAYLKELEKQYGGRKKLATKEVNPGDMGSSFSKP